MHTALRFLLHSAEMKDTNGLETKIIIVDKSLVMHLCLLSDSICVFLVVRALGAEHSSFTVWGFFLFVMALWKVNGLYFILWYG